jgi:SAM-dependent methyltransferase
MITITPGGEIGNTIRELGYISGRKGIALCVLPITRYLRAKNAERYIVPRKRLLDIGCGDGYFIRRSKCEERYGLDKLCGDVVTDTLSFPDNHFDYVTMLAVIEHLPAPQPLLTDIHRVLVPGGRLVLTTPARKADRLIRLYVRDIEDEHETYYTPERIHELTRNQYRMSGYHTFLMGLNQAMCLEPLKQQ